MREFRPVRAAAIVLAMFALVVSHAGANERADYFDTTKKPFVRFDNKLMTWTIGNKAVERVIRYDAAHGALMTSVVRDLESHREIVPAAASEGEISFASALKEPPRPLTGWKMTETPPPAGWEQPGFSDAKWAATTLPLTSNKPSPLWFRVTIPADRMVYDRAYSLIFDHALGGDADVYVDGILTQKISARENAWNRSIQIDLLPKNRVLAVKFTPSPGFSNIRGTVGIAEVGTSPQSINLAGNWKFMIQSVNTGVDNSMILTITLSGLKQYEGFDLDVAYQVYPGEEPTIAKWFTFVSHRATRFLIDEITLERWHISGLNYDAGRGFAGVSIKAQGGTNTGMMTAVLSPLGEPETSPDSKIMSDTLRPYYLVKPGERQMTAKAITAFYHGDMTKGAFLYQLYVGQYLARATANSVPTTYRTTYAYGDKINAATCEKIIPIAAQLGAKVFTLDNGWQTNIPANSGSLGDWITDKTKFPLGLIPISLLVREQNMRFGLYANLVRVDDRSQIALDHPVWTVKNDDGTRREPAPHLNLMCFTSGWEENISESLTLFCRAATVNYLKLDSDLLADDCADPAHDHPVTHSLSEQFLHWNTFADKMRTIDAKFVLSGALYFPGENAAQQDTYSPGTPELTAALANTRQARDWYAIADSSRRNLSDWMDIRPAFTLSGEVPCHLMQDDKSALEYYLTSMGATAGNLELVGKLDEIAPAESVLVKKWVKWNEENRPWLAYGQPLPNFSADRMGITHVDVMLHLRNEYKDRYGYLCLWNESAAPATVSPAFKPANYYVRIGANAVVTRVKDGSSVGFSQQNGTFALNSVTIAPHGWEIYEIRSARPAPAAISQK